MFFDVRAAKLLAPGAHLMIDGCPGLRLVAGASVKTWTYRYRTTEGALRQVRLGHWPAMSVQAAAAAWQAASNARRAGGDPGAERRAERAAARAPAPNVYTVQRLVDDFVAGHLLTHRKEAGAEAAKRALDRLLEEEPDIAGQAAAEVTRAQAFKLLERRQETPTGAAKLRSLLGQAWDYALDAGLLEGDVPNWWRVVMKGRLKSRGKIVGGEHVGQARRALQPAEIGALVAWKDNLHTIGADALVMYLWTCTRGSEIFSLRPEHVSDEPDGWWWTVPKELTKNARHKHAEDLRVPLLGHALEVVRRRLEHPGAKGWLFEDEGEEQYTQHRFSTYIYDLQPYSAKAARRKGEGLVLPVTNWTPHNLRRTSRTLLAQLGCPEEVAEAILGHLPAQIVGTYNAYTYDAERRTWLGKLSTYLAELASSGAPARP